MDNILLITRGFPIGNHEKGFLETEYVNLKSNFKMRILAILPKPEEYDFNNIDVYIEKKASIVQAITQLKYKEVCQELIKAKKKCKLLKWLHRCKAILGYSARAESMEVIINEIVKKHNINMIYTYWCTPASLAGIRIKERKKDLKVITRFHGFDLFVERNESEWQVLREYIADNADGLFFACEQAKRYFTNTYQCDRKKIHVAYLGTEKRGYNYPKNSECLKLVSCSTTKEEKRVSMIAEVVEELNNNIEVEWLHIGGEICRYENLEGKKVKYKFLGQIDHDNITSVFRDYNPDLFITLSTTEGGVPVSIQEAYSMGIPALGTRVGGIPEIICEDNGILVDLNENSNEIAKKILNYYYLPIKEKKKYSRNAFMIWKEKFNAEDNARKFIATLRIVLDHGGDGID